MGWMNWEKLAALCSVSQAEPSLLAPFWSEWVTQRKLIKQQSYFVKGKDDHFLCTRLGSDRLLITPG